MRIRLIAAGTRLPDWVDAGVADYARRIGRGLKFELVEVPLAREAERMRQALREGYYVVALEVKGSAMTTEQLAQGYTEEKMEVGAKSTSVLGVSQAQQGGVSLDTMVQRLVQKSVWEIDSKYK